MEWIGDGSKIGSRFQCRGHGGVVEPQVPEQCNQISAKSG
jgi:hypothetical protein